MDVDGGGGGETKAGCPGKAMAGTKQEIMGLDRANRRGSRWRDAQKAKWTGHRPYRLGVGNKALERCKAWSAALEMGALEKERV